MKDKMRNVELSAITRPEDLASSEDTKNIAFVPSLSETNYYFTSDERKLARNWWLKSRYTSPAAVGIGSGSGDGLGYSAWTSTNYIRPMIWVSSQALPQS